MGKMNGILDIPKDLDLEFLSVPYTHDDPKIEGQRLLIAQYISSKLSWDDRLVYSPVVHFAGVANKFNMPTTWEYWKRLCYATILNSTAIVCVQMEGWGISTGVQAELKFGDANDVPIQFLEPDKYIADLKEMHVEYDFWYKGTRFIEIFK